MLDEIPWEQLADGKKAKLHQENEEENQKVRPLLAALKFSSLQEQKLYSINIISAEFHGKLGLFTSSVSVFLWRPSIMQWLGVYALNASDDDDEEGQEYERDIPSFCLRRAIWRTKKDVYEFRMSPNKGEYVKQGGFFESHILFGTPLLYPEIDAMMGEIRGFIRQGIALQPTSRLEFPGLILRVKVHGDINFSLDYVLNQERNEQLEAWAKRWDATFTQLDYKGGIVPDDGCVISYSFPIEEVIEYISS